ncbi:hypothetical protein DC094_18100 [Pelagibaculum spongiae]|uniref:Uncharacterized protein n=2 Tax=Pelagibaculum spongiae TaxID=2080658 RepID=A0A2V1GSJ4_9GAMM|nr:hypothetical protein DC094_18100 [Pelagibaculum spongiae]
MWHTAVVCMSDGIRARGIVHPAKKIAIAHAVAPNWERTEIRSTALPAHMFPFGSTLHVFRHKGPMANSMRVGHIANKWVTFDKTPRDYTNHAEGVRGLFASGQYSMKKAISLTVRSSAFGSKAVKQVEHYMQSQNEPPMSVKDPTVHRTMFCSMFTIAVWQAVLGTWGSLQYMEKDAMRTSPMALHGYFLSTEENWEDLGELERDWSSRV